jgi:hypothetical protein
MTVKRLCHSGQAIPKGMLDLAAHIVDTKTARADQSHQTHGCAPPQRRGRTQKETAGGFHPSGRPLIRRAAYSC